MHAGFPTCSALGTAVGRLTATKASEKLERWQGKCCVFHAKVSVLVPALQAAGSCFPAQLQAAGGDSRYSGTQAGVCNAKFYLLPSSCRLCWPDVLVCEAEVLCGLPRRKDSEVRTGRASL